MKYKLEELCEFITDGTHQTPKYCEEGGVMFLSSKDVTARKIDWDNVKHIPESLHEKLYARLSPRKDDILLAKNGTTGVAALVDRDEIFDVYVSLAVLRPKDIVYPKYLLYAINSPVVKKQFDAGLKGVGVPNLHLSVIRKTEINIEKYGKQLEVCGILDKVASIIDARKEELQKLDELIKARFVEMFGDPISNPKGLPVKNLQQISTLITNGNTPKGGSENYISEGILFLRSQNVWRNRIELDDVVYIDEATHHHLRKSSLKNKDILITKTGRINTENSSLGRAALYFGDDDLANINGHIYLVRLDGFVVPEFVLTILTSEAYRNYIRKVCVGGIDKRQINLDQVEDFPIILPPLELQAQFAAFVEQTDKSKVA